MAWNLIIVTDGLQVIGIVYVLMNGIVLHETIKFFDGVLVFPFQEERVSHPKFRLP